jgi:carotenoid cleavage dioxygenase
MDVEIVGKFLSTLPEDDDHPYRTGPWRPQTTEWDADDLTLVEGDIPHDLDGVYLRNTENPLHPALKAYHPFDGDGMLHVVGFRDGKAFYRNRFIRTEAFLAENEAGGPLWPGLAEPVNLAKRDHGWGARGLMKDASSTDVIVHRGTALTSFYQCGDLYRLDPYSGDTLGTESWNDAFPFDWGVSAHPKVDDRTGELLFFNYSKQAPYMHYGVVDERGGLVHYVDVALPGPRLPHDMAFTENYAILNDFPRSGSRSISSATPTWRGSTGTCRRGSRSFRGAARAHSANGSRRIPRSSCTSPTLTRTATRSSSTASSRAIPNRPTTAWATSGSGRFASSRWTACRPGCTAGASTW